MLNFKNIIFNPFSKKLNFEFYESYEITNFVKKMTYRLILSKTFQSRNIHDVFHVLLFELYINKFDIDSKLFVIEIKKEKQWKVESILDDRIHRKKKQFFVKWLNYFEFENQWTKKIDLKNCKELLIIYNENRQIKKKIIDMSTRKRKKIDRKKWDSIKDRRWRDFIFFSKFSHKKFFLFDFKKTRRSFKKKKKQPKKKFIKKINKFYFKLQINSKIEKRIKD